MELHVWDPVYLKHFFSPKSPFIKICPGAWSGVGVRLPLQNHHLNWNYIGLTVKESFLCETSIYSS